MTPSGKRTPRHRRPLRSHRPHTHLPPGHPIRTVALPPVPPPAPGDTTRLPRPKVAWPAIATARVRGTRGSRIRGRAAARRARAGRLRVRSERPPHDSHRPRSQRPAPRNLPPATCHLPPAQRLAITNRAGRVRVPSEQPDDLQLKPPETSTAHRPKPAGRHLRTTRTTTRDHAPPAAHHSRSAAPSNASTIPPPPSAALRLRGPKNARIAKPPVPAHGSKVVVVDRPGQVRPVAPCTPTHTAGPPSPQAPKRRTTPTPTARPTHPHPHTAAGIQLGHGAPDPTPHHPHGPAPTNHPTTTPPDTNTPKDQGDLPPAEPIRNAHRPSRPSSRVVDQPPLRLSCRPLRRR